MPNQPIPIPRPRRLASFLFALAASAALGGTARAGFDDGQWGAAYEFLSRQMEQYTPDLPLAKQKQKALDIISDEYWDYQDGNAEHDRLIEKWIRAGHVVQRVLRFGTEYRATARRFAELAHVSGTALEQLEPQLASWSLAVYVHAQNTMGGSNELVVSINLINLEDEASVEFALYHELGHALWQFAALRDQAQHIVASAAPRKHEVWLLEYFADSVAALLMRQQGHSKEAVLAGAKAILALEPEGLAHPPGTERVKNLEELWTR